MDWTFRFALWLTVFAWLATGIGSLIALLTKRTNETFLAFALGFSAWVMLYVSFVEILQKWFAALTEGYWNVVWWRYTLAWFFWWIAIIAIIDTIVPQYLSTMLREAVWKHFGIHLFQVSLNLLVPY